MKLYMAVTADKYELPIAIEDSAKELAKTIGVKVETIYCAVCLGYKSTRVPGSGYRFRKVMVEEE